MEFNWSTFVLEIINFLVLVWLLSRFLYRPVMNVIDKRRHSIQQKLNEADSVRSDAETLRDKYRDRLAEWEREKSDAMKQLRDDLEKERKRLTDELHLELEEERKRAGILNQRQMEEEKRNMEREALHQAAVFSAALLERLAGPELESGIIDLVIDDMGTLSPEKQQSLKEDFNRINKDILITSVYPITEDKKNRLEQKLGEIKGGAVHCTYSRDPALITGLRIRIGSWLLEANFQGELKYFLETEPETE